MKKAILLNFLPLTSKKQNILDTLLAEYLRVLNLTLKQLPNAKSSTELHHLTYSDIRKTSFLPSDIVEEARKDVWAKRKTIKERFTRCSVRLNKRWFKFFKTDRGTPSFKLTYSPRKHFVIPVRIDGSYKRFEEFLKAGWNIKTISLLNGKIAVNIEKEYPEVSDNKRNVIGIDIGSSTLAAVTVYAPRKARVIKQLYFGRDVASRQRKYEDRLAKLRSHADKGSEKAKRYLKKLKHKQANFVKTRSAQIAKEIVNLALKYNASVAVEKLSIRGRKHRLNRRANRRANRKINHIPYAQFREFIKSNSSKYEIPFQPVDAYHTSKWCPRCGALNKGHSSNNYAIYKCNRCGMIVNSDRKASLAVAIKSALVRELQGLTRPFLLSQFTRAGVAVNQLFCPDDGVLSGAVHFTQPLMESPWR
ncbi:putative transposase DNA-binding domain protein [archaeon BMS3Bbin15]|nr:putative transposase DNA-binding domain protein [archaeon BMS3Bbin15]